MSKRSVAASRLEFIPPRVPTLVDQPPEGDGWIHEVKFDGYRVQVIVENGSARVFTRKRPQLVDEVLADLLDRAGAATPIRHHQRRGYCPATRKARLNSLCFVAFDLLHLDGRDLRARPLIERREWLAELVPANPKIQFSKAFDGDAAAIFCAVEKIGLEGIVSKRADCRCRSGPSKSWLKIKCFVESDLYVGSAIVPLKGAMRDRLWERVKTSPASAPKGLKKAGARWVQPGIVGRVRFVRGEGGLRNATLKEVRED